MSKPRSFNATGAEASHFISLPATNNSKETTILHKEKILYVESKKKHTCLVMAELNLNKKFSPFVISKDIGHYIVRLPVDMFLRVHKSCCVNLNYITRFNKTDNMITMSNDKSFKVAARRRKEFYSRVCM